jgi:hypothetical protein
MFSLKFCFAYAEVYAFFLPCSVSLAIYQGTPAAGCASLYVYPSLDLLSGLDTDITCLIVQKLCGTCSLSSAGALAMCTLHLPSVVLLVLSEGRPHVYY